MKRTWLGTALSLAILSATVIPAAGAATFRYTESFKNAPRREVRLLEEGPGNPTKPTSQPEKAAEHSVAFGALESAIRENNQTVEGFQWTLSSIYNTDIDLQINGQTISSQNNLILYRNLRKVFEGMTESAPELAAWGLQYCDTMILSLQGAIGNIENSKDDMVTALNDQYKTTSEQLNNATNQLITAAQSAYIGIITAKDGLATLDRALATLDRNLAVVEKQKEIGMASTLTLENLQQTRKTAATQRDTLVQMQRMAERQLALLLGEDADVEIHPIDTPKVSAKNMADIDYDKDLETALKNSYTIWAKQDAVRSAAEDYEDAITSSVDVYEGARVALDAAKKSVRETFHELYDDVQDKYRLLVEAETARDSEQKNYDVAALRYERGMISRMDYLAAQDTLLEKQDAVKTAELNLFTAYNAYDWARRGFMSGMS